MNSNELEATNAELALLRAELVAARYGGIDPRPLDEKALSEACLKNQTWGNKFGLPEFERRREEQARVIRERARQEKVAEMTMAAEEAVKEGKVQLEMEAREHAALMAKYSGWSDERFKELANADPKLYTAEVSKAWKRERAARNERAVRDVNPMRRSL